MAKQSTIQEMLSIKSPRMSNCKIFTLNASGGWPAIRGEDIIQWENFTRFGLNQDFGELLNDRTHHKDRNPSTDGLESSDGWGLQAREAWYERRITLAVDDALRKLGYNVPLVSLTSQSLLQRNRFFPGPLKERDITSTLVPTGVV